MTTQRTKLDALRASGIMIGVDLEAAIAKAKKHPELVEGFLRRRSVNPFIGDNTIGKTPLCIQLGLCVALGKPFLGRAVQRGTVLYIDGETDEGQFLELLNVLVAFLGETSIPDSFTFWSPNWHEGQVSDRRSEALSRARHVGADLTVIDCLRSFFPRAETKQDAMNTMISDLRGLAKDTNGAVVITHHTKKAYTGLYRGKLVSLRPDLVTELRPWLETASGMKALIGNTDTRLGMDTLSGGASGDVVLCGLVRGGGTFGPLYVDRVLDDGGDPRGYEILEGVQLLNQTYRAAYYKLPTDTAFGFREAQRLLGGNSASNTSRFLRACIAAGIVIRSGNLYMRV